MPDTPFASLINTHVSSQANIQPQVPDDRVIMKVSVFILLILVQFTMLPAGVFAGHTVFEDVVYATHPDVPDAHLFLKGDVYVPSGDGPYPALMLMHGGGLAAGG